MENPGSYNHIKEQLPPEMSEREVLIEVERRWKDWLNFVKFVEVKEVETYDGI
jgi:hypothetical protein